ncbi:MAG TPA: DUF3467 domain-containing protein [Zoogloea sp.]|jgi:hypothetical protein|nr:DUF3467 domain-containing protein [Zoogloea sp.]
MTHSQAGSSDQAQAKADQRRILVDSAGAATNYSNSCHVASTKEEIVLNFGLNQAWDQGQADLRVQVTNRIILSPFAAKRLALLLGAVVQQYERQYGALDHTAPAAASSSSSGAGSACTTAHDGDSAS